MTRQKFTIVHLSEICGGERDPTFTATTSGFSALSGDLTYREVASDRVDRNISLFLPSTDVYNYTMRALWREAEETLSPISWGVFTFRNFCLFGEEGLLLHPASGYCLVGHEVNWSADYARGYIEQQCADKQPLIWSDDHHTFEVDFIDVARLDDESGIIMCSPGQKIYGHWILDYVPRLYIAQFGQGGRGRVRYYFRDLPKWTTPFLKACGLRGDSIGELPNRMFVTVPSFTMPSAAKDGIRLGRQIHRLAWDRLRRHIQSLPIPDQDIAQGIQARKLFVTRRRWESNRAISNIDSLEEIARSRGYVLVEPSRYSIPAQAALFRNARIVLGEDGSGLHNVIFAERGCRLGVISPWTRQNLWHAAICQILEHRISYMRASKSSIADETLYKDLLDRLEMHAAI